MKSRTLLFYVLLVDALALAALASLPVGEVRERAGTVLLLAALAALVGSRPVRVPALRTEVTASDAFALAAMGALGPLAAGLIAMAGVLGAALGQKRRRTLIRLAFNLGCVPLSMILAAWVFLLAGGSPGRSLQDMALPLAAAATIYFLINTGLVTLAVAMDKRQPFLTVWRESSLWTAVAAFTGLALAAGLLFVLQNVGPWGLILGIPPCWVLAAFYRTNKQRIEEQGERVETVEVLNAELERSVAERTRKLQEVLSHVEGMNRQLRETNEQLVEASRIKSEFLANVSHELRTPLNAVIGFSELLADPTFGALSEQQREFISDIHDSGEHLLHLINNILDLSKIEAGKLELRRRVAELPEVLREAAAMLRPQAQKKELCLSVLCSPDVKAGEVDAGMFREVLVNLLSNAVKFTPKGGRVDLEARRDGVDLIVEVRDNGIGISAEDQQRIFEEFYQVDGSYSRNYQGTGLGLALVQRMVQMHGGSVTVDSALGRGSTFTCRFPHCLTETAAASPRAEENQAPLMAPGSPTARTILVVEDNPVNRKMARNALRSRGYRVLEASSGEQALEILHQQRPDLVLMDIQLPGMDGLEVTRRLKADPLTSTIQVVALTAHAQKIDEERARSAGCAGYITKPIRLTHFPSQVESYFVPREGVA